VTCCMRQRGQIEAGRCSHKLTDEHAARPVRVNCVAMSKCIMCSLDIDNKAD